MNTLIVFDSVFGNTEQIARAIGAAIELEGTVRVAKVSDVPPAQLAEVDLLVVGSPTRAFRPLPTITTFLKNLPAGSLKGKRVAAFDTRISVSATKNGFLTFMVKLFGYAAKPISDALVKKGGTLAGQPEGFIVTASEGPLQAGELERAASWAGKLVKS